MNVAKIKTNNMISNKSTYILSYVNDVVGRTTSRIISVFQGQKKEARSRELVMNPDKISVCYEVET